MPDPAVRESARATLAAVREGGDDAVRAANERVGGGRPDGRLLLDRGELRAARDALEPQVRRALDQAIEHVRRFAETAATGERPERGSRRDRARTPLGAARQRRLLRPWWLGALSVVPGDDRRPGTGRGRRAGRRRLPRRPRGRRRTRSSSAPPACSRSTPSWWPVARRRSAALAYGLPDAGLEPVDRIVGPGNAWVTAAKIEVCGEVGIDLPAGPSEGMVLAAPPARRPTRRGRPHHPGRARPGFAGHPRDDRCSLRRRRRGRGPGTPRDRVTPRHPRSRAGRRTAASCSRPTSTPRSTFVNAYGPEHLSVDVEPLEPTVARLRNAGSLFVGPWAPESAGDYATGANHVLPTGGLARSSGGLAVEAYGKFVQVQRIDREGLAAIRDTITTLAEAEGLLAHRDAVARPLRRRPGAGADEPDAGHLHLPDRARPPTAGRRRTRRSPSATACRSTRSSASTSTPPRPRRPSSIACWPPASSSTPLSEYPPSDYRRLIDAAAARYGVGTDELLVGAGADEILDLVAKAFLAEGARAVLPAPTYAMYRVLTEQRGAEVVTVPRRPPAEGWALDVDAVRAAARGSSVVWLCSPNNPTGLAEPDGTIETLLDGPRRRRRSGRTPSRRSSSSTRRTRSSSGRRSLAAARDATRGSSSCAPRARPTRSPACASGSRSPARGHRPDEPVPAAGLGVDGFGDDRDRGAARPARSWRPTSPVSRPSATACRDALIAAGWSVGPRVTNFLLVDFGSPERAAAVAEGLLRRGIVPRTFAWAMCSPRTCA